METQGVRRSGRLGTSLIRGFDRLKFTENRYKTVDVYPFEYPRLKIADRPDPSRWFFSHYILLTRLPSVCRVWVSAPVHMDTKCFV